MMVVWSAFLGLAVGSFLNAYIFRLRHAVRDEPRRGRGGSVWRGRSYCPQCKKSLRWYELIPVVSFAAQWGRCRGCKERIDWQYPAVELAAGILFVLGYMEIGSPKISEIQSPDIARWLVMGYLFSALMVLFVYDLRYGLVPDRVVLPAIAVAFAYNVIASAAKQSPEIAAASGLAMTSGLILATAIGAMFFIAQYYISHGRWIGAGDIRLGALMGATVGWPYVILALMISYIAGGIVSVALLAAGRKRFGQTVPLGTFLTVGTLITMLYGQDIVSWYMRLL